MITMSKSALAKVSANPLLTRDDIAALLVAYYGAVRLDEVSADDLYLGSKRKKEECTATRYDHLRHIYLLLNTLSHVSDKTLAELTVVAATHKPTVVRKTLIDMLAEGSSAHLAGDRMWTSPEFFSALVQNLGRGNRALKDRADAFKRMMRWFDPVDPIRVAAEYGYYERLSPKIWK